MAGSKEYRAASRQQKSPPPGPHMGGPPLKGGTQPSSAVVVPSNLTAWVGPEMRLASVTRAMEADADAAVHVWQNCGSAVTQNLAFCTMRPLSTRPRRTPAKHTLSRGLAACHDATNEMTTSQWCTTIFGSADALQKRLVQKNVLSLIFSGHHVPRIFCITAQRQSSRAGNMCAGAVPAHKAREVEPPKQMAAAVITADEGGRQDSEGMRSEA
eukprot:CAMPEP_0174331658 /NCGR_PEP_ID=MMETSP0810-20121108/17665_1 /TAXON_ID=73025 ORGANISM="Eutreptiella gymnastica-like, Strain CCMP1594" /NCGR_SAMPLE_ID=MMETSP0810 /ASSEMBLY_ACC=CAM_ASM_000659 /LENGTH=212 /DNA_ID=CAMNT_0015447581 /DNA_START=73 /DNA_END=712 /DNA_ORIENTATION=+